LVDRRWADCLQLEGYWLVDGWPALGRRLDRWVAACTPRATLTREGVQEKEAPRALRDRSEINSTRAFPEISVRYRLPPRLGARAQPSSAPPAKYLPAAARKSGCRSGCEQSYVRRLGAFRRDVKWPDGGSKRSCRCGGRKDTPSEARSLLLVAHFDSQNQNNARPRLDRARRFLAAILGLAALGTGCAGPSAVCRAGVLYHRRRYAHLLAAQPLADSPLALFGKRRAPLV